MQHKKWIIAIVVAVVALVLVSTSMFTVQEGEYKVVLKFGEAVRTKTKPGLHFKWPFIETVSSLPKYQIIYDSKPTPILTRDKKPIEVDNYTVWKINNPTKFLRTLQTLKNAEERIDNAVYSTVRQNLSNTIYGDIISENKDTSRNNLNDQITKQVISLMNETYGVEIIDVRIKKTDLPEQNKLSVFNRMVSDRQSIAAKYLSEGDEESRKITAKADREASMLISQSEADAKRTVAEGEQEAARIYNESYGKNPEFYKLYRTLESYKVTFKGEPVIMLPITSPYAKILLGQE